MLRSEACLLMYAQSNGAAGGAWPCHGLCEAIAAFVALEAWCFFIALGNRGTSSTAASWGEAAFISVRSFLVYMGRACAGCVRSGLHHFSNVSRPGESYIIRHDCQRRTERDLAGSVPGSTTDPRVAQPTPEPALYGVLVQGVKAGGWAPNELRSR